MLVTGSLYTTAPSNADFLEKILRECELETVDEAWTKNNVDRVYIWTRYITILLSSDKDVA